MFNRFSILESARPSPFLLRIAAAAPKLSFWALPLMIGGECHYVDNHTAYGL